MHEKKRVIEFSRIRWKRKERRTNGKVQRSEGDKGDLF